MKIDQHWRFRLLITYKKDKPSHYSFTRVRSTPPLYLGDMWYTQPKYSYTMGCLNIMFRNSNIWTWTNFCILTYNQTVLPLSHLMIVQIVDHGKLQYYSHWSVSSGTSSGSLYHVSTLPLGPLSLFSLENYYNWLCRESGRGFALAASSHLDSKNSCTNLQVSLVST